MEKKKQSKKHKKKKKKLLRMLVVILFMLCIVGGIFTYKVIENGGGLQGILASFMGHNAETLKNLDEIYFIILGESEIDDYKLTDTIMVCSYDPKNQTASMLSIPRDTYVGERSLNNASTNYIASYKINTLYRNGENLEEVIEKINEITNLNVQNYVLIDTDALVELVDAIGGVWFDVPEDMNYDDESQDLHIDLKAGYQLLDGKAAEGLVRFRMNNDGTTYSSEYGGDDYGRMRTQRDFIAAAISQTVKVNNIFKIRELIDIAYNNIKTNVDINLVKDYVPYVVNFNTENIKSDMLPGKSEFVQGKGVWIYNYDEEEAEQMVYELFLKEEIEEVDNTVTENTIEE